jgi:hypothetical protein
MGEVYLCTRARSDAVDIDVVGALTSSTARHVRAALRPYRSMLSRLRLRGCTDIDLDGVLALHAADMEAREGGGEFQLLEVPPLIERYLRHHDGAHLLAPPRPPEDDGAQGQRLASRSE